MPASSSVAEPRVHLALVLVQLIFSGFHVLAAMRVAVAIPLLTLLSGAAWRRPPGWRDQLRLCLLGLFGVFANQLLFIIGLQRTNAINASILMPSIPVFACLVAAVLRVEQLRSRQLAGIALAVAGALVLLNPLRLSFAQQATIGNLLVLANCLSYAIFLVLQRPLLNRHSALTVMSWSFLWGGSGVLAVGARQLRQLEVLALPPVMLWKLGYITVIASAVVYSLNAWSIRRSSSVTAATYTTIQPLFTALLAFALLGERVGLSEAAGALLIICGLWQVSRS